MATKMKFYDVRARKSFTTSKYAMRSKSGKNFAVATGPSGVTAWRIVAKK